MSKPTANNCKGCGATPTYNIVGAKYQIKCPKENCWVGSAEPTQKAAAFKWNMAMRRVK